MQEPKIHCQKANIIIELGDDFNKNSNAVVDKAIQELEREITIIEPNERPIDRIILSQAVMTLNERLRRNGQLSAWNIMFSRDDKKDQNIYFVDQDDLQDVFVDVPFEGQNERYYKDEDKA